MGDMENANTMQNRENGDEAVVLVLAEFRVSPYENTWYLGALTYSHVKYLGIDIPAQFTLPNCDTILGTSKEFSHVTGVLLPWT